MMSVIRSKIISGFLPGLLPSGTRIRHWKIPAIPYILTNDVLLHEISSNFLNDAWKIRKGQTWEKPQIFTRCKGVRPQLLMGSPDW